MSSRLAAACFGVAVAFASAAADTVPIAYVVQRGPDSRTIHAGEVVTVQGVASVDSNVYYRDAARFYVQDATAGVAIYHHGAMQLVHAGDIVRATGRITTYAGMVELYVPSISVIGHEAPPTPRVVRSEEIQSGCCSGLLVQVTSRVVDFVARPRGSDARLSAGRDLLTVHLTQTQQPLFNRSAFEPGTTVTVTGIATPFGDPPFRPVWEVLPRWPNDVQVVQAPPRFTFQDALRAAAAAVAVVVLVLVWIFSLRRRVKREMQKYEQSERRFRALADTSAAAVFIYQGVHFLYVNHFAEELTGYGVDELIGQEFWSIVHPDDRELIRRRGEARLRGEKVPNRYEFRVLRRDGSVAWVDFTSGLIPYEGSVAALGTAFDITERKRAEHALLNSEKRFRTLFENSSDGIALVARDGSIQWVGPSTEHVLGWGEAEMTGATIFDFVHADDHAHVAHELARVVEMPRETVISEYQARKKDGTWCWIEITATNLLDDPAIAAIVANYRDITERKKAEEEIRHQALHDVLTGLPNRSLFQDRLELALVHARRGSRHLAVIFVDLDLFKRINDVLGHTVGDHLLQAVAGRLTSAVRASDTVARFGGDEFTLVLEGLSTAADATAIADKIADSIDAPFDIDGHRIHVTASIGVTLFPNDGDDADTLIRNADKAMYRGKELGRHNVQMFTEEMNRRYHDRLLFESDFRRGLERNEFVVHYQPIFDVDEKPMAVEALVRWQHPERGLISPDEFIPAAEESRLIAPLGAHVLRTACLQLRAWRSEGVRIRVAVNLSVRQFQRRDILATVDAALAESGIDPALLELEITESAAMENVDHTRELLHELRRRGVHIAIDDFGAGQSSLTYLRRFPIHTIKIDRLFIRDVTEGGGDAAIVSAVIRLAHDLGLTVTAEGVETAAQKEWLVAQGCHLLQGYHFSRPLPADELRQALAARGAAMPVDA